jgi:exonuclease III
VRKLTIFLALFHSVIIFWLEAQLPLDQDVSLSALLARALPILGLGLLSAIRRLSELATFSLFVLVTFLSYFAMFFTTSIFFHLLSLYGGVVVLHLWFQEIHSQKKPESSSRSLWHFYFLIIFLVLIFYVTVRLGLWEGFYLDRDIARGIFVFVFLSFPILRFLLPYSGRKVSDTSVGSLCLGLSLWSSHLFLKERFLQTWEFSSQYVAWAQMSILIVHLIIGAAIIKPFIPHRFWEIKLFRFSAYGLISIAVLKVLILFVINLHIELNYSPKDRAKGIFQRPSAHLQSEIKLPSRAPLDRGRQLRVLNVNVWGVEGWIPKFILNVTSDLERRMSLFPSTLASYSPDLIIIQELWSDRRKLQFIDEFRKLGYPFFVKGSDSPMAYLGIGNGLLIVSKLPLDERTEKLTFSVDTRIDESFLFARKGVLKTRVMVGPSRWVDVYNSHLGGYGMKREEGGPAHFIPEEQAMKLAQAKELGEFILRTRTSEAMVLGIDLNTHPLLFQNGKYEEEKYSPEYQYITCTGNPSIVGESKNCLGLQDPLSLLYPGEHDQIYTYDTKKNYYATNGHFSVEPPARLDYIFSSETLRPLRSELILTETELSDHYGLLMDFEFL